MAINWDEIYERARKQDARNGIRDAEFAQIAERTRANRAKREASRSFENRVPTAGAAHRVFGTLSQQTPMQAQQKLRTMRQERSRLDELLEQARGRTATDDQWKQVEGRAATGAGKGKRVFQTLSGFESPYVSGKDREAVALERNANSALERFVSGYKSGVSLYTPKARTDAGRMLEEIQDNSAAYSAGNIAGEITQYAVPYAGLSGRVGKVVSKIPFVGRLGAAGQAAARSAAADVAIGLPLNLNSVYNKQGLRGEEALREFAINEALDLGIGGVIEIAPMLAKYLKSGKTNDRIASQIKDMFTGNMDRYTLIEIGNTPSYFKKYGANTKLPLTMSQSTVRKIAYPKGYMGGEHGLGFGAIDQIEKQIKKPLAILRSDTQDNSVVVITKLLNEKNEPVLLPIHFDKKGQIGITNDIPTMYGKEAYDNFIKSQREKGNILFENKKIRPEDAPLAGLQLPKLVNTSDPMNSISNSMGKSNKELMNFEDGSIKKGAFPDGGAQRAENTTPEAWKTKLESDKIYEKWRNVDFAKLSEKELEQYQKALIRSNQMWEKSDVPDFMSLASSSSDNTRPLNISSPSSGDIAGTQTPSMSSLTGYDEVSTMRPDSVKVTIKNTSPNSFDNSILPENTGNNKDVNGSMRADFSGQGSPDGKKIKEPLGADVSRIDTGVPYQETYGTFEETQVPKATPYGDTSKTASTLFKNLGDKGQKTVLDAVNDGDLAKYTQTNLVSIKKADKRIENTGYERAASGFKEKVNSNQRINATDIAMGARLIKMAQQQGDTQMLSELIADYTTALSEAGRTTQAAQIIKRLTPEGRLIHAQKIANRMANQFDLDIVIPEKNIREIANAVTDEEVSAANKNLRKVLWNQVPGTFLEKMRAWRYIAMLFNPRTHFRNIFGNAMFKPLIFTRDTIAAGAERIFLPEGKRTKSILGLADKNLRNAARDAWKTTARDIYTGVERFNDMMREPDAKLFNNRFLEWLRKLSSNLLEREDVFFGRKEFERVFANYMKANGYSVEDLAKDRQLRDTITSYALEQAEKSTYRDYSEVANWLARQKNKATSPNATRFQKFAGTVLDTALPFTKTPINILKRGLEFSPASFAKAGIDMVGLKNGTKTASDVIQDFASGLTGTGAIGLGYALYNAGVISPAVPEDNEGYYRRTLGEQSWALNLPDGRSFTIDWAAPATMAVLVGTELGKLLDDGNISFKDGLEAIYRITDPLVETTMLQSLNDIIESGDDEGGIFSVIGSVASNYVSQMIPSVFGQFNRAVDNTRRSYTSTEEGSLFRSLEKNARKAMQKLPGASFLLEPYVDQWGREQENGSAFEQFFSPGYIESDHATAVDQEILRLGKRVPDETGIYPSAKYEYEYMHGGKTYRMTEKDWTQFQKTSGQYKYDALSQLFETEEYQSANDADKVKMIEGVYREGNFIAKAEFLVSKGVSEKEAYLENASDRSLEAYDVVSNDYTPREWHELYGKISGSVGTGQGMTALYIAENGLPEDLYTAFGVRESTVRAARDLINAGWTIDDINEIRDGARDVLVDGEKTDGVSKAKIRVFMEYMYPDAATNGTINAIAKVCNSNLKY